MELICGPCTPVSTVLFWAVQYQYQAFVTFMPKGVVFSFPFSTALSVTMAALLVHGLQNCSQSMCYQASQQALVSLDCV